MVYMPRNFTRFHKKEIARVLIKEGIPSAFAKVDEVSGFTDEEKKHMSNDEYFQYVGERESFIVGMLIMHEFITEDISC